MTVAALRPDLDGAVIDRWWPQRTGYIAKRFKTCLHVRWSDGEIWRYDVAHTQFLEKAPLKALMICLRCGYVQKKKTGDAHYTKEDKAHRRRCDFNMTIRYMCNGKIVDSYRTIIPPTWTTVRERGGKQRVR